MPRCRPARLAAGVRAADLEAWPGWMMLRALSRLREYDLGRGVLVRVAMALSVSPLRTGRWWSDRAARGGAGGWRCAAPAPGIRSFWPTWITERVDSLLALSRAASETPLRAAMWLRVSPERTT